jgi:uncharacterized membrane protein YcaP (DUF421 family)
MEFVRTLIGPDTGAASAPQMCVRAIILFVFGIICIRIAGRRTFSQASPVDIIIALVVGSNISRAMTGKAPFFPGMAATLLLVVLHRLVAMAALRWPGFERLLKGPSVVLIRDGAVDHKAMRRHGISDADLAESLRMEQVERPEGAHLATMEDSGKISVVKKP